MPEAVLRGVRFGRASRLTQDLFSFGRHLGESELYQIIVGFLSVPVAFSPPLSPGTLFNQVTPHH